MPYKVKEVRKEKGFTQEELSEKSGVSRATISLLENDPEAVTLSDTLIKLADALKVRVQDIFLAE